MKRISGIPLFALLIVLVLTQSGCIIGMLFYHDWSHKKVYKSAVTRGHYFEIKAVTQSHCGCSDLLAVITDKNETVARMYYGGSMLFPASKYEYIRDPNGQLVDTIRYDLVSSGTGLQPLSAEDQLILHIMDSLTTVHDPKKALVYPVKKNLYTGLKLKPRPEE